MLRLLKKYFIPHVSNNHKPHILRYEAILAILTIALLAEIYFLAQVFVFTPFTNIFSSILPSVLTDLTNLNRKNDNLSALTVNPALTQAALLKAQDMAAKSYFAHTSPEGKTPWHWLEAAGYQFVTAGENLAVNFVDSQDISSAWMNSPKHRANILNNNFTEIGISSAKGIYQGKETIFVAQFFGRPAVPLPTLPEVSEASPQGTENSISAGDATQRRATSASERQESFSLIKKDTPAEVKPQQEQIALKASPQDNNNNARPAADVAGALSARDSSQRDATQRRTISALGRQLFATPRAMTNYLFIMIFTIISLALMLKIFIKIKIQYPRLIANGVFTLLFISSLMWLNQFLAVSQGKIF